ncbi:hypothetical protein [Mesoplasma whartonense]|uniref:hypothetical protein n=1 Tax=Mesoplasma whartonense TaxID=2878854 RepID=UPI0020229DD7|nr:MULTISPECIES: hypothetical protein [unclassified Mesoplasma]MCL8212588.1 hypothetical protein [Mesoplasma sp. JKS002661]MCL8216010.1 hypothetical protein [Mesoplasma sp. JKS002657]
MNLETINQEQLTDLMTNNETFKLIDADVQARLRQMIVDQPQPLDLTSVDDQRVGIEFLKYLFKKNNFDPTDYYEDLLMFLKICAGVNHRHNITQSDLVFLSQISLPIANWKTVLIDTLKSTMFKELYQQMDLNGDYKDQLVFKITDNNQISEKDYQQAQKNITWGQNEILSLTASLTTFQTNPQMVNEINQTVVNDYYQTSVDLILRRLKFQTLGFQVFLKSASITK